MFISNSGSRGYTIANSLRLRSSASAYLSRTLTTPTSTTKWTWSGWVKRGAMPAAGCAVFAGYGGAANQDCYITFGGSSMGGSADQIGLFSPPAGNNISIFSSAVYRDPSAWYHVVVSVDTTQGTAANRVRIYVNGAEVAYSGTPTYPTASQALNINSARAHYISGNSNAVGYFDGYLAEQFFVDGQQLTPSSFGQTDTNGVWVPKAYSGTYGTNGFYLKFDDGSNTTNLCLDRSGNGNNWTPTNVSLSAGSTYDWSNDTPTNVYCVLNPLDTSSGVMAEGNLAYTSPGVGYGGTRATVGVSSGKWYWEVTANSVTGTLCVGISSANEARPAVPGESAASYGYQSNALKRNNATPTAYGATWTTNDVIGVALDLDAGTLVFYKNNSSQGTAYSSISGTFLPMISDVDNAAVSSAYVNFGQRPFTYTPPTGFKALCSANLPAVTIANPKKHFDVLSWAGDGNATRDITGLQFTQDFTWIKNRSSVFSNTLYDTMRGVSNGTTSKALCSDQTIAEGSLNDNSTNGYLSAFLSNGFSTVKGSAADSYTNYSGKNYVAWNWKANGAGVTNTSGTITSTVSANTTAGFSIVTYTGTNTSGQSVGHGLGVVPAMVITKRRGSTGEWMVKHKSLGSNLNLILNQTSATYNTTAGSGGGIADLSSSSVFSFVTGSVDTSNSNPAGTMVAYCFAEVPGFSKFGSYTGNGSADGPFVYCGFRPRWVLVKSATVSPTDWLIYDTARNTYNVMDSLLQPNTSAAQGTYVLIDALSNGFKIRNTGANGSGETVIYAAFAENPFGGSNIAPSTAR